MSGNLFNDPRIIDFKMYTLYIIIVKRVRAYLFVYN